MADTVTTEVISNDRRYYVVQLTGISDGTGETAVHKIAIASLAAPHNPEDGTTLATTLTAIDKIEYAVSNNYGWIKLEWDHTTPAMIAVLPGGTHQCWDYRKQGGLVDPQTAGGTGDIILTTSATPTAKAAYNIIIWLRKKT